MVYVDHINYADNEGNVYCCMRHKIVPLSKPQITAFCFNCKMFNGYEEEKCIHCNWQEGKQLPNPFIVNDPKHELLRMQKRKI